MNKAALLLALSACVDLEPADELGGVEQESHSTSVAALPNQIVLARLDDSATSAVLQYSGQRLFANRADYAGTPMLHHYFSAPVNQLIVGDFALPGTREAGRDQVCAKLSDGTLECTAVTDDRTELADWFSQLYPLLAAEQPIVGDFTGDGADDILAFNPATGSLRLFDRRATGTFTSASFALGNLATADLRGKKLYAGEFGQATNRADLLVVDPSTGTVSRYDTVSDSTGKTTFWWSFTTGSGALAGGEQLTVANLEGGNRDGLLLRNPATGAVRAMRAEYGAGYLAAIPSATLSTGQLPVTTHTGTFAAVRLVDHSAEPSGANRDDTLFFDQTTNQIVETSARYDGSKLTYWWGWTKATPTQSWVTRPSTMALVLCQVPDQTKLPDIQLIEDKVIGVGTGSIRDFLVETTYGTLDIQHADVIGWVRGTLRAADSSARVGDSGWKTRDYLDDCMKAAGITSAQYGGRVYVVLNEDNVSSQGLTGYGATMEYADLFNGRLMFATHELLHAFGLDHANDNSGMSCGGNYCDTSSVMGNYYSTLFVDQFGNQVGPGLNAMNLDRLGVVPASRIADFANPTTSQSHTVTLAAVEAPEANGVLYAKVRTATTKYFTVALRMHGGYDRNVPVGVQIHELDPAVTGVTTLHTYPSASLQPGQAGYAGGYYVFVNAIDTAKKTATITLSR